jgi:predicted transcriptional regulator
MADKPTTVRIPAEIKSELEEIANKERRSLNAQIVVALAEHIANHKGK